MVKKILRHTDFGKDGVLSKNHFTPNQQSCETMQYGHSWCRTTWGASLNYPTQFLQIFQIAPGPQMGVLSLRKFRRPVEPVPGAVYHLPLHRQPAPYRGEEIRSPPLCVGHVVSPDQELHLSGRVLSFLQCAVGGSFSMFSGMWLCWSRRFGRLRVASTRRTGFVGSAMCNRMQ